MMNFLKFLTIFWLLGLDGNGQIAVSLRLNKSQYVAGEPVVATVHITNHAGRELLFGGDGRRSWLDFAVRYRSGQPVNARMIQNFGPVRIGAGQTMQRQVNLGEFFMLHEQGNYSVIANVRSLDDSAINATSNRVIFTQNPGRVYWSQKVGFADSSKGTREFRVLQFRGDQKTQLYAQVLDRRGLPIATSLLGDMLSVRKPSVTVDRAQRMHVLFLISPTMWSHCVIDGDGALVSRKMHQRATQGDPSLVTFANGEVQVGNSVLYDARAAAIARARIRGISERPTVLYE